MEPFALWTSVACWALWTAGVALRWATNVYQWHWRVLLPASAVLELVAFALFFRAVSGHKPSQHAQLQVVGQPRAAKFEKWVLVVIVATVGLMFTLLANLGAAVYAALYASG